MVCQSIFINFYNMQALPFPDPVIGNIYDKQGFQWSCFNPGNHITWGSLHPNPDKSMHIMVLAFDKSCSSFLPIMIPVTQYQSKMLLSIFSLYYLPSCKSASALPLCLGCMTTASNSLSLLKVTNQPK